MATKTSSASQMNYSDLQYAPGQTAKIYTLSSGIYSAATHKLLGKNLTEAANNLMSGLGKPLPVSVAASPTQMGGIQVRGSTPYVPPPMPTNVAELPSSAITPTPDKSQTPPLENVQPNPQPSVPEAKVETAQTAPTTAPSGTPAEDLANWAKSMAGALAAPGQITSTPIAGMFATPPKEITGLGDDYFQAQKNAMKEQLRQEFFGPVGKIQGVVSGESAAGRLGSGVGKRIIEETAMKPLAQAQSDLDAKILQAQLEERSRVQGMNAEQYNNYQNRLAQLSEADSKNALTAATANAQLQSDYNKLMGDLWDAAAGRATQTSIAELEAKVRLYEAAQNSYDKNKEIDLNYSINAMKNALSQMELTGIDPTTGKPTEAARSNMAKELLQKQQNLIDFFKAQSLYKNLTPEQIDMYNSTADELGQPHYQQGGSENQPQIVNGFPGQTSQVTVSIPLGGTVVGTDGKVYQKVNNGWLVRS